VGIFFLALEIKFVVVTKHINLIISFKMKSVNPWLIFFLLFCRKPNGTMIDIDYLHFLENILTDNRKEKFLLQNRTNHFTIAVEDIFQMHNTSAVMRSCEFWNSRVKCNRTALRQSIDKEIAMGAQNGLILILLIVLQIVWIP
jgi:hypothetical protein